MKKLFYGLGAVASVVTPVVAVVSCGHKAKEEVLEGLKSFASTNVKNQINGGVALDQMSIGGNAGSAVTEFMINFTHNETVRIFRGLGLLKETDTNTDASSAAFKAAIEGFNTGFASKITKFIQDEYTREDGAANANAAVKEDMIKAQMHKEGFKVTKGDTAFTVLPALVFADAQGNVVPGVVPEGVFDDRKDVVITDQNRPTGVTLPQGAVKVIENAERQGHGDISYLSFKVKLEDTHFEKFFTGLAKPEAAEATKFAATQKALIGAFQLLSEKTLDEI